MPRISFSEMTTYRWSFDEDVTGYHSAGIRGIGVWRRKLSDFGEERGAELLQECGLSVSSLTCAGGFTGADGQSYREAMDDARSALQLAAEIGAECLVVVPGGRAGHTTNHARRLVREALRSLGDMAGELGVQIALQPMHRDPFDRSTLFPTLDMVLDFLEHCQHSEVGLLFDMFHLWQDPRLAQRIPELAPHIRIAALCDARSGDVRSERRTNDVRCLPGEGVVPLPEIIRQLEEAGFQGWYDVQILSEECWRSDYSQLLADCRRALVGLCPEVFCSVAPVAQPAEPKDLRDSSCSTTF